MSPAIRAGPSSPLMYKWIRPEILLPVHGEMRHMAEQARFGAERRACRRRSSSRTARSSGSRPNGPALVGHERVGRLILDGDVILPADGATMNERRRIALHGLIAVTVALDARPASCAASRRSRSRAFRSRRIATTSSPRRAMRRPRRSAEGARDEARLREAIRLAVRRRATQWTGKKPVVEVSIIRV